MQSMSIEIQVTKAQGCYRLGKTIFVLLHGKTMVMKSGKSVATEYIRMIKEILMNFSFILQKLWIIITFIVR